MSSNIGNVITVDGSGNATFDTKTAAAKLQISGNTIQSAGSDAAVDINLTPKGTTGGVKVGNNIRLSDDSAFVPVGGAAKISAGTMVFEANTDGTYPTMKFNNYYAGGLNKYVIASSAAAINHHTVSHDLYWLCAGAGAVGGTITWITAMTLKLATGKVGFMTTAPDKQVEINSADGNNLRLTYNDANGSAANYCDLLTTSSGDLTVTPSGKDAVFNSSIASNYATDADFDNGDVLSTGIASGYGLLVVKETVTGKSALFRIENQTIHIVDADASFSTTKDAPSINVYWEADQYKIQNASTVSNYAITVGLFSV